MCSDDTTQPAFITLKGYAVNITGQKFGRLTALGPVGRSYGNILWLCQCSCGNTVTVISVSLRSGHAKSCGCLRSEITSERSVTHGMSGGRIHSIWLVIIQRCTNPNNKDYHNYGERGIAICREWKNSFDAFYNYVSNLPNYNDKGYSLDRIDNDKGYEQGNLRWATRTEQNRNSRRANNITFQGKTQCIEAWAEEVGIESSTLQARLSIYGWSVEKALTTPVRSQRKKN